MNFLKTIIGQQKSLSLYIFFTMLALAISIYFSDSLYGIFGAENYITIHLLFEIFIIFFSLAISMQIWLSSKFNRENDSIYLGALFLFLAILEIIHALSYKGMPFFIQESDPYLATWFYMIPRLLLPIGLILILLVKEKHISERVRHLVYGASIVFALGIIFLVYFPSKILPDLVDESGTTILKNTLQYIALIIQIVVIALAIRGLKKRPRRAALMITASVYLIFSDVFYTNYYDVYDIYNFMGHIFQLFAFLVLFKMIYYSSVERPFIQLLKAKEYLEKSKREMHQMAYYDDITLLPNERYLHETLSDSLNIGVGKKALITFEVDRLDSYKRSLGTLYVEKMLKMMTDRIQTFLPQQYSLYKLREDQCVVYVKDHGDSAAILKLCNRLQEMMAEPFQVQHLSLNISVNIGVSFYPKDASNGEELLKFSQIAMHEAKNAVDRVLFYHPAMLEARTARLTLENDLQHALANNELYLEYQPQLNLRTGEILSMEALIRWQHPEKGFISPLDFISIAEETGLIVPIGQWVLETACQDTFNWQQKTKHPIQVAVNLSMGQLYHDDFVKIVQQTLEKTKLEPKFLQLEMTESMTMNTKQITPVLEQLKALGVTIAVDDFGTGYSSLSYLKDFPIDCLKIDRGFIRNILQNKNDEALVALILSMAKHLHLKVVAEGIESLEQLNYLKKNDCDIIQGYLISKPIRYEVLINQYEGIQKNAKEYLRQLLVV
ncbi:bifunctional diguanylate cyclase/phosphodiesterase [Lysinibacillus sp. 54212]|uniref:bifunctional diguanylate cyclase/phosphodiesterase n=1 Tax=Lysinibacillus sp. 54212 TaxID=3119829 RepID=UPI002FC7EA36